MKTGTQTTKESDSSPQRKKLLTILIASVSVILIDQLSKILITKNIIPISYTTNTGAGFGLFQDSNSLLIWLAVIIIGIIIYLYNKIPEKESLPQISTALIIGGAIGNLIDRIRLGHVIDFIDLKIWPSFNIADSAITIGAIILIFYLIKKK